MGVSLLRMTIPSRFFTRFTPASTLLLPLLLIACGGSSGTSEGSGAIHGIAYNIERVALPPRCTFTVELLDSALVDSLQVDERLIGRQVQELVEPRVPLEFTVRYDPARVDTMHRSYRLDISITRPDGSLAFRNDRWSGAVVPGRPDSVEIVLQRIYDDD